MITCALDHLDNSTALGISGNLDVTTLNSRELAELKKSLATQLRLLRLLLEMSRELMNTVDDRIVVDEVMERVTSGNDSTALGNC